MKTWLPAASLVTQACVGEAVEGLPAPDLGSRTILSPAGWQTRAVAGGRAAVVLLPERR